MLGYNRVQYQEGLFPRGAEKSKPTHSVEIPSRHPLRFKSILVDDGIAITKLKV